MSNVLLIEDDAAIRTSLTRGLRDRGHAVSSASAALDGLRLAVEERPDLIVLDLGLPDMDGLDLLRMLRAVSRIPVIVATARDGEAEMVTLLDAGADDYIIKPFSSTQLDARIRAVLRRAGESRADSSVTVGGLRVDPRTREATLDGVTLDLSPKEFDLLHYLAARPGEVITKRELLTHVWQIPYGGADKTVDVHLSWLRRKLGETSSDPRYLQTVRGVGIRLAAPA
ncbi:DNA-binding response regulator, OmpR family, contains REC and winged-helix (wHTH) domain [Streptosporangium subroseum]|uniref:DNA-binding response regulator, OmpR family, contains REC and winged-helix (WHTH) domain n=1 Tax=Streptosporangium subroseum TaxID=106412 RepID=A0A239JQ36_9ACTN|nr:response regulator transcription factor [Streptosporangium subroseum]SNT08126.1 DNA-binding response regulator, OmpR family, contains REC and winged-helix (wHTH) domain [Streptosporangium subroseum]